ncbi:Procollagen galactosyltransferase 1 [Sphaceloma murrayae]|uniref:Procollagen galactosyltransferase 1 n=1 Tax=Sphaceloma murrayae TaxID=2082308 RepID=A0A2K1QVF1_9PEZI|nr:Procollagen galactosyltransferase 1 [Sphaceloma murrayae]
MAAASGLQIQFRDGVDASTMSSTTLPQGKVLSDEPGYLGSWRGHLDILNHIVHSGIRSALILEDDVDWDMQIRDQMASVANALSHARTDESMGELAASWDVLWLGHMGDRISQADPSRVLVHDTSVVPVDSRPPGFNDPAAFPDETRVIHRTDYPLCTYGYAVSYEGAKSILYQMSRNLIEHFDTDLANYCRTTYNCLSVTPPLIYETKEPGRGSDTDGASMSGTIIPNQAHVFKNSTRAFVDEHVGRNGPPRTNWLTRQEFQDRFDQAKGILHK